MINGAKLTYYMKVHRFTNQTLAKEIGVTAKSVSDYRNSRYAPKLPTLRKMAKLFNVSVDALITDVKDGLTDVDA